MCLIMFGQIEDIRKLDIQPAWQRNHDGAGVVILGKPATMIKGIMKFSQLRRILKNIPSGNTVAIHLRYGTHGKASKKWTHPFEAGHDCWLMHNGVLQGYGTPGDKGESDSAHLADILSYLPLEHKLTVLESIAGYSQRFLLIQNDTFKRFGNWREYEKVYMSNDILIPAPAYQYTGNNNWSNKHTTKQEPLGFHSRCTYDNFKAPYERDELSKPYHFCYKNGAWIDKKKTTPIVEESKPVISEPPPTAATPQPSPSAENTMPRHAEVLDFVHSDDDERTVEAWINYARTKAS